MDPLRSLLFVPGNNERRVTKALHSAADGVVLDLEDAVAVSEKEHARDAVRKALALPRPGKAYVRVNGLATPWCLRDVMVLAGPGLDGLLVPKVEDDHEVHTMSWLLDQLEQERGLPRGKLELVPIIETARGLEAASRIAGAAARVRRLAFGAIDLAADMDLVLDKDDAAIAAARFAVAQASRANRLQGPLDTAFIHVRDGETLRWSTLRARALGFEGKFCIHPDQIAIVNEVFTPTVTEIEHAQRVVAAFQQAETAGSAALLLDGTMLDYPVVERARRTLAIAARIDAFAAANAPGGAID